MALRNSNHNRGFSNSSLNAAIAGLMLGVAAFFLKLTMTSEVLIIISPYAWLTAMIATAGFLLLQKSLQGYVSRVMPITTGVSILMSVILAFVFLAENIAGMQWFGILLILAGVFGLAFAK